MASYKLTKFLSFAKSRVKRFLLYAALFLVLFNPPAEAQIAEPSEFTLQAGIGMEGPYDYDGNDWAYYHYWTWLQDSRSNLRTFGLIGINATPEYIYIPPSERWLYEVRQENDGKSSVFFIAPPGDEIYDTQIKSFFIYVKAAWTVIGGGWCAAGDFLARCDGVNLPSW